jgi:hypothetical protein
MRDIVIWETIALLNAIAAKILKLEDDDEIDKLLDALDDLRVDFREMMEKRNENEYFLQLAKKIESLKPLVS